MESPFASLGIPRVSLASREKDRYLVLRRNGERIVVEASSAAEAVEKSGAQDASKIINLAYESEQILEKGALNTTEETVQTQITLEERLQEFQTADLLEEAGEEEAFTECDLVEFSKFSHQGAPRIPEPETLPVAAAVPAAAETVAAEPSSSPPAEDNAPPPSAHPLQPSEKQLTPEEVDALLKSQ